MKTYEWQRNGQIITKELFRVLGHVKRVNVAIRYTSVEGKTRRCGANCGDCEWFIQVGSRRDWEKMMGREVF